MSNRFTRPELERILDQSPRRVLLELALSLLLLFTAAFAVVASVSELAQLRDDVRVIRSHVEAAPTSCKP